MRSESPWPRRSRTAVPLTPQRLGYAGLLPQLAAVLVLLTHQPDLYFLAQAASFAYAALILSFLGGMWWGLAARQGTPRSWIWVAAVLPSLAAFASAAPWALGWAWPRPSLAMLGLMLIGSLSVDRRLSNAGLTPGWWMSLRVPLSMGLGFLTIMAAWV